MATAETDLVQFDPARAFACAHVETDEGLIAWRIRSSARSSLISTRYGSHLRRASTRVGPISHQSLVAADRNAIFGQTYAIQKRRLDRVPAAICTHHISVVR